MQCLELHPIWTSLYPFPFPVCAQCHLTDVLPMSVPYILAVFPHRPHPLSHHQCVASSSTVGLVLVPPICAVMRAGSLKTLGIGPLNKPDQVVQVLGELPHCTHLSKLQLEFALFLSEEVRHVTFVYSASTVYILLLYTCTRSEVGSLCLSPQQGQL